MNENFERGLRTKINPVDDYVGDIEYLLTRLAVRDAITCPHCGESYYYEGHSVTTLAHWQPIVKDGVVINRNPNKTTHYCHCLNCGEKFSYQD